MSLVAPSVKPPRTAGVQAPSAPAQNAPKATSPFIRGTRKQSTLVTTLAGTALTTAQIPLAPIQIRPSGFLARIRLLVTGTTTGNAATVAFANDAPFNLLQNIMFQSPAGDVLISPIDGFSLFQLHKLGAFASGLRDPLAYPIYSKVTGAGSTGGSFAFEVDIPVELDSRDAFGVIQNMNAAEQFVLSLTLGTSASLYTTAPTTPPTVTITATMDYYSQPAPSTDPSVQQFTTPIGNGSLSIIQSQTVTGISPSTTGRIQIVNTGTVLRGIMFIARTASGARTEADWPSIMSIYLNNQQLFYKPLSIWRNQINESYKMIGAPGATPVVSAPDNGVLMLTDFMDSGSEGGLNVDGASNRNQWLATGKGTDLEFEATTAWGAAISSLQIVTLGVRPISAQSLYAVQPY